MKKFAVFSGFLGSGKTTTMMALTRFFSARYGKAAMIREHPIIIYPQYLK